MEHVGDKIRELREARNLSQREVADRAGIGQSHVSRLESAENKATTSTLRKIAVALGVDVGELVGRSD